MAKKHDHPNFLTSESPAPKETHIPHGRAHGTQPIHHTKHVGAPLAGARADAGAPAEKRGGGQAQGLPLHKRRKKVIRYTVFAAIAVILVVTIPAGIAFTRAAIAGLSAKASLTKAKDNAQKLDLGAASQNLDDANASLTEARRQLQGMGFWRDVPGIGTQVRAMEDAAQAGSETLDSAQDILSVFQIVTDALKGGVSANGELTTGVAPTRSFNDLSKEEKRDVLQRFSSALPKIRTARDKIDLALEFWNRVPDTGIVAPVRIALKPLADTLPILKRALDESVPLLEAAVPLAGYPNPISYLVLLQNSDELRPGGGFIGTVGTMSIDAGDLSKFEFNDIYNIDNPASYNWHEVPPAPLAQRLGIKAWYMRDANWSPDFPTSAERLLDFYKREVELGTGKKLPNAPNSILALEPGFFTSILKLTGPVTIDGKAYDANNFFDLIEYQVEEGFLEQGIPLANRKDLIQKLGDGIVAKLKSLPASRWPEIVDLLTTSLQRKQIMIYSRDKSLLASLDSRGWTGRAKPTTGDFVWAVDANLAALKTDGVMDKKISYKLDAKDPTNAIATVTLTYTNTNRTITWRYTRYRSYTRVYVPEGSTLISSAGAMKDDRYKTGGIYVAGPVDVTKELGKTSFGAFWSIEPGKTGMLTFTYKLPARVFDSYASSTYHLDWPKQAGADKTSLTLDLNLGKTLKSAVPSEDQKKWGDSRYEYQTDSLQDRMFDISF